MFFDKWPSFTLLLPFIALTSRRRKSCQQHRQIELRKEELTAMTTENQLSTTDVASETVSGDVNRRSFLTSAVMCGGLAAGYGTFFVMAGRFLYSSGSPLAWMYVAPASEIKPGSARSFTSPTGLTVVITRNADSAENQSPPADDFLALSSICPHLGCRVHWEPHNDRFFCPCHNGAFDPTGQPIAGPPKADNQSLPEYPLMVADGQLFIEMPVESIGENDSLALAEEKQPDAASSTPQTATLGKQIRSREV